MTIKHLMYEIDKAVRFYIDSETSHYIKTIESQEKIIQDLNKIIYDNKIIIKDNEKYRVAFIEALKSVEPNFDKRYLNHECDQTNYFKWYSMVYKFIQCANARDLAIIYMYYIDKGSVKELAQAFGISDSSILRIVKNYRLFREEDYWIDFVEQMEKKNYLEII